MSRLPRALSLLVAATLLPLTVASVPIPETGGVAAEGECAGTATYGNDVTAPATAAPGFPDRRITTTEINAYLDTVDGESDRVTVGTAATSWGGQPIKYALVGDADTLAGVDEVAAAQKRLRDPRVTDADTAAQIAEDSPAIVWYAGNVHGGETSGADAAVSILYDLAARTDCTAEHLLDELVVGIMPTQNPDGRDRAQRTNTYQFDMNRDWFARTQPATDGKLDLLAEYPPVLFIDAHEMGGTDFFFPPNADPIHHEISDASLGWINDLYGAAMQDEFDERGYPYFNYDVYDLFYMGYGDTVPTTAFTAAGMTFEKGTADTDRQKWEEQLAAGWTSIVTAADHKDEILRGYYDAHVSAVADGAAGRLEDNLVVQPDNEVQFEVPEQRIRHYFLLNTRAPAMTAKLVERLDSFGVEIHRLTEDLTVGDLSDYGDVAPAPGVVPAGSYWIPMAQPQKRWIQAVLGEDPYSPFPYFYDVTSWSNPLMMNVEARFSGAELQPEAVPFAPSGTRVTGPVADATHFRFPGESGEAVAAALAAARAGLPVSRVTAADAAGGPPAGTFVVDAGGDPAAAADTLAGAIADFHVTARATTGPVPAAEPFEQPDIAVYRPVTRQPVPLLDESHGHLRYLLDRRWQLPHTEMTAAEIAAGALTVGDYDVLLVGGSSTAGLDLAAEQIRTWISDGGVYVGTARPGDTGGTAFAVDNGYTTAQTQPVDGSQISGTIFEVSVDAAASPVTLGADGQAFWFNLGEEALTASTSGLTPVRYPDGELFFSGFARNVEGLRGTAGLVDETLGDGRVVLFSGEPNFRAYTESPSFFLANALASPAADTAAGGRDVASPDLAADIAAARASVHGSTGPGRTLSIEVAPDDAEAAEAVLSGFTAEVEATTVDGSVFLEIPNPRDLDARHEHPFARRLLPALRRVGITVRSAVL